MSPTASSTRTPTRSPTVTPTGSLTQMPSQTMTESPTPTPDSSQTAQAQQNSILGNSLRPTPGPPKGAILERLGIDIGADGVTANDGDNPGTPEVDPDSDIGPNDFQNYPELSTAVTEGQSTVIDGILLSVPNMNYRIEFFSATECTLAGHGPAEVFLGFEEVTTDANGMASIASILPRAVPPGDFVVSTATRLLVGDGGETSEFSACVQVQGELGPCPTPFPDFIVDGVADALDLIELIKSADSEDGLRDITGDGQTNGEDFLKFSLNWQAIDCSKRIN